MTKVKTVNSLFVVGGVDTYKDLHVSVVVVDQNNRALGIEFFLTTR
ncbi:hypothetical protein I6L80_15610 [Providencia rettgeri]|nr:hypothetical protein I6L80_15610 [Providencia rettgeri]